MVWSIEFGGTADLQAIIQAIGGLTNVVRHQVGATNPTSALEKFRKLEPPTLQRTQWRPFLLLLCALGVEQNREGY